MYFSHLSVSFLILILIWFFFTNYRVVLFSFSAFPGKAAHTCSERRNCKFKPAKYTCRISCFYRIASACLGSIGCTICLLYRWAAFLYKCFDRFVQAICCIIYCFLAFFRFQCFPGIWKCALQCFPAFCCVVCFFKRFCICNCFFKRSSIDCNRFFFSFNQCIFCCI